MLWHCRMIASHRLILALLGLGTIILVGMLGYVLLEDFTPVEALYMTIITISTVGYSEVRPLTPTGMTFTVVLIVISVGVTFYLLTAIAGMLIEGQLRDLMQRNAMKRRIAALSDHVIVCGYGRVGATVAEELQRENAELVVIESDSTKESQLVESGHLHLIGSAISDEILERAGVERARFIIPATGSDPDNVFITLAARDRNPGIRVHARAETPEATRRLKRAGADQVITTYYTGAVRLALSVLRPNLVDFLEVARPPFGAEIDLEEIRVEEGCEVAGERVGQLEAASRRLRVVAVRRGEQVLPIIPDDQTTVGSGDRLIVIGEREGLDQLASRASRTGP
jgi:voltage-gated potassium channel